MIFQRGRWLSHQPDDIPMNRMSQKVVFLQLEMGDKIPTSSIYHQQSYHGAKLDEHKRTNQPIAI